jgi:protein O-GlcNAc transferase
VRDRFTQEFRRWPEHWREAAGVPDARLADQLRRDEFDVLVDLSGHFPFNSLHVLAERVAPAQIAYPNYPGTTGSPCVDYILTDRWTSPPGTEGEYSERLHHIPTGYLGFDVSLADLDVGPLPMIANRRPTFGVFQRFSKFTSDVWNAVAAVLTAVPDAALVVQNGDEELDRPGSQTSRTALGELDARGIDLTRVQLRGCRSRHDHLRAVSQVDVSLDTCPYNGQTTTCESLWMGVPVVTLFGHSHVGRVGGALVARTGHADWIARSISEYCAIAASLVSNADALGRTRRHLRGDVIDSGLTDGRRLAGELEAAYQALA